MLARSTSPNHGFVSAIHDNVSQEMMQTAVRLAEVELTFPLTATAEWAKMPWNLRKSTVLFAVRSARVVNFTSFCRWYNVCNYAE